MQCDCYSIILLKASNGQFVKKYTTYRDKITYFTYLPNGKSILISNFGGYLRLLNINTLEESQKITSCMSTEINKIFFFDDGKYFITDAYNKSSIQIWNTSKLETVFTHKCTDGVLVYAQICNVTDYSIINKIKKILSHLQLDEC